MIGGWIISEIISRNEKETLRQYTKKLTELKNEQSELQKSINKKRHSYNNVKIESDELKHFLSTVPEMKINHAKMTTKLEFTLNQVHLIRTKLKNREYSNNPFTKNALMLLVEYFPTEEEKNLKSQAELAGTFSRIKSNLDSNASY